MNPTQSEFVMRRAQGKNRLKVFDEMIMWRIDVVSILLKPRAGGLVPIHVANLARELATEVERLRITRRRLARYLS